MLAAVSRFVVIMALAAFVGAPSGAQEGADQDPGQREALVGGSEDIDAHQGSSGDIDSREGRPEELHDHEGSSADLDNHEGSSAEIEDHHADSDTLEGRSVESERLSGMENDPDLSLSQARQKLLDARQRHSRAVKAAEAERSEPASPEAGAPRDGADHRAWSHRLEMARHQILVAEAQVQMMDASYAKMLHNDYPRGDARQQLIDQRQQAKQQMMVEQARLPELVSRARQEGVPEGLLSEYSQ